MNCPSITTTINVLFQITLLALNFRSSLDFILYRKTLTHGLLHHLLLLLLLLPLASASIAKKNPNISAAGECLQTILRCRFTPNLPLATPAILRTSILDAFSVGLRQQILTHSDLLRLFRSSNMQSMVERLAIGTKFLWANIFWGPFITCCIASSVSQVSHQPNSKQHWRSVVVRIALAEHINPQGYRQKHR